MEAVTVSQEFQVQIPVNVRERAGVRIGQKFIMLPRGKQIILIPVEPVEKARGSLRGMDTSDYREEEDEER
jgi:bifunctional DNA-binding transcriptional regulator/antitoxin component of YhaV-PrlF toxin-antitoxin module